MHVITTDPITLMEVKNTHEAPFVLEGFGESTVLIYFESEDSRLEYIVLDARGFSGAMFAAADRNNSCQITTTVDRRRAA